MTTNRKIGIGITLAAALFAAAAIILGYVSYTVGVGIAVIGILIGTGVARGAFSRTQNPKRN